MSLMPHARKAVTAGFLASLALSLTPAVAHADEVVNPEPAATVLSQPEGDKRYIVRYENNVNAEAESASLANEGIEVKDTISTVMQASVVVANDAEIEELKNSAEVASVELDQKVSIVGSTSLWGLDRVDQRTGFNGQYGFNEGAGVNVYVIDSGINDRHVEFAGRIPTGWSGMTNDYSINDCNGHGTHVAGTIAGTTYGVAKKANIIPLKALDCNGNGWSSTVVAGIDWAVAHHQPGQPAVMNMSIGGFSAASLDYAVQKAVNDGITVVAASGNSGQDACSSSPAKVGPAITVAAIDSTDTQASWANYGSCVDIQAPGVNILSAWKDGFTSHATMSGTSMAAPHVAGAAAVMLSQRPYLSPAQVHQSMINNSTTGIIKGIRGTTPNRLLYIPSLVFTDISGSGFIPEITWMKDRGISTGYGDGTYRPYDEINRDAMAAFMYRLAGSPAYTPPAVSPFTDLQPSDGFYKEINWMRSTGITTGYGDGTFQPQGKVTREAMAAFMSRFNNSYCKLPMNVPSGTTFTDIGSTAFPNEVKWMKGAGVSTGYADGTYRPLDNVTREAMAAFMNRLDNHIAGQGGCRA